MLTITISADPNGTINRTYANDDANIGIKDQNQTGNVISNDDDPEHDTQTVGSITVDTDNNGTPETFTPVSGVQYPVYQNGVLIGQFAIDPGTGAYLWDPESNYIGTAVIPYTATDGTASAPATLYLTTVPPPVAMPVTLVMFTAKLTGEGSRLNWATTSEENFDRFVVQKSNNPKKGFTTLTEMRGGSVEYQYVDKLPYKGVSYYRLKMVDLDGTFAYSKIISAYQEHGVEEHVVYPNPATGHAIYIENRFKIDAYKLYDAKGKEVRVKMTTDENQHKFNVNQRAKPGIYILKYRVDGQWITQKVVLMD